MRYITRMIKLPEFPYLKFPSVNFPSIDLSAVSLPFGDYPSKGLPRLDADKLTAVVRDAAYVTVGIGVLAVQQAQTRRSQLLEQARDYTEVARQRFRSMINRAA
jgi:hypothetical protein